MRKEIIKNEKQFARWFKEHYKKLGFSKIIRGEISKCPDFIMLRNDKEIRVELETLASNFIAHKHSLDSVDEIICIIKDIELDKPVTEIKELEFNGPRKVTLSIESEVYEDFQKYCEDNAIMLSKKVELIMKDIMQENNINKEKDDEKNKEGKK